MWNPVKDMPIPDNVLVCVLSLGYCLYVGRFVSDDTFESWVHDASSTTLRIYKSAMLYWHPLPEYPV